LSIWVCGEVLIDLIPGADGVRVAHVGGGPANTAKALARLGHVIHFIDGISSDEYGQMSRKELLDDEVKLDLALKSDKPTCTAEVTLAADGGASYVFTIDGTATFDFNQSWLPDPSRYKPQALHIGTLAIIVEPSSSVLYEWAIKVAEFAPIVLDPNVRPSVVGDRIRYVAAVEKWAAISSVIKLSDDDMKWLYPDESFESVAQRWIAQGASVVVITRGSDGLIGFSSAGSVEVPGVKIEVADTVGAGDTVGAILVEAMVEKGLENLTGEVLKATLHRAAVAAGITCSRKGAQPPYKHELKGV
jgi:fructokinase